MTLSSFTANPSGTGGSIKVYLNGQLIGDWNGLDTTGTPVPNGFYHFVLEEHDQSGNIVILARDAYIDTNGNQPAIQFVAIPNAARTGDTVQFFASFAGISADGQSTIKIYSVAGEWIKTLTFANGKTTWDTTNNGLQQVASGVYLAVLEGVDPTSQVKAHKIIKVMVLH
jgi:flagellar hook assembly protein FlgD